MAAALFPLIGLLAVLWDIAAVMRLGRNPIAAASIPPGLSVLLRSALVALVLAIVPPVLIAPWVARSRGARRITRLLRHRSRTWAYAYVALCCLTGWSVVFAVGLETVTGDSLRNGVLIPEYRSKFLLIQGALPTFSIAVISLALSLLGASNRFLGIPGTVSWQEYLARLELLALSEDYAPIHGRKELNLNAGGLAPLLTGVQAQWQRLMLGYQLSVPGSKSSVAYLEDRWLDCKLQLSKFGIRESPGRQVRLTACTGRALELAFQELASAPHIILSPYEHPTELAVAQDVFDFTVLKEEADFFERQWEEQRDWIALRIVEVVEKLKDRRPVIVVSEVSWSTGYVIPVADLQQKINEEVRVALPQIFPPIFVVDGAHAVGNLAGERPTEVGDAYVFSSHKWLLSPEPAGLVLSVSARRRYDAWVTSIPVSSVGAASVCGLAASLSFLGKVDQGNRIRRATELKRRLLDALAPELELVGRNNGLESSLLFSVKPAVGFRWKWSATEIRRYLAGKRVNVEVIDIGKGASWVRFCCPFFLDWRVVSSVAVDVKSCVMRT